MESEIQSLSIENQGKIQLLKEEIAYRDQILRDNKFLLTGFIHCIWNDIIL